MEIDCGLGAFFGLQKGYVLAVIHKKVLGQDSRATGVADDVEVLFDVGISEEDTDDAPVFPDVWEKIAPMIEGLPLVAHNSPFDEGCLKEVFKVYQMDYPDYEFYDTLCVSRRVLPDLENHQLQTVAAACGYELENHHHALADAEACAWIAREIL